MPFKEASRINGLREHGHDADLLPQCGGSFVLQHGQLPPSTWDLPGQLHLASSEKQPKARPCQLRKKSSPETERSSLFLFFAGFGELPIQELGKRGPFLIPFFLFC
eukprot:TRINITY_DN14651_c1_g1_i3.p1 TRINITY_DN14651_c1_g1~~TRINITY_DN14651_c1_g1_i3.p1  ORF type:complete len:106 (-),score=16.80 TRINITY_DN14651_c1_g1_i3:77-394(-)